jgi:hypothetical protein
MSAKRQDIPTGAQLRALRDIKLADRADPAVEARRHEASFLSNMRQAKTDFDWILANQAWTQLGFPTFADWWDERVAPLGASLGMRPTREIAKTVIEKVVEDQRDLPKAQQRTQREIAAMVGVDRSTVARSAPGANARGSDLEDGAEVAQTEPPADPLDQIPAARDAVDAFVAEQAKDITNEEPGPVVPVEAPPAQPEGSGVTSGSAPAKLEEIPPASTPADPEQAGTGVTPPAPDPKPSPVLAWAQDSKEFKAASMRRDLHGFMEAGWKVVDQIDPGELAPFLKPQVIEDVAKFRAALDGWLAAIGDEHKQYTRPRLVKEA